MNEEHLPSQGNSTRTSRLSHYSQRYYHDKLAIHPWSRRPCSRVSGIPFIALRAKSCSARLDDLARPKIKRERHIRQEYFDNIHNYTYTGIKSTALTAQCSDRVTALAQPKKTPDGYAFPRTVSQQARYIQPTDGVQDSMEPRHLNSAWKNKQK